MALLLGCSLVVLNLEYWAKEVPEGNPTWELAQRIRTETPQQARIISVSGGDPTLLYLAHRKGWLKGPGAITESWLRLGVSPVVMATRSDGSAASQRLAPAASRQST